MEKVQMMLGLLLILTLLALCGQAVSADTDSRDVPATHPAYQAVKMLLGEGYLQLYQDQTFQGDKPVDRYTLAIIVARILDEISSGKIGTSKSDIDLLRNLTKELHDEFLVLSSKGELLDTKLADLSRQNQVLREDLTSSTASVQDDQNQLQKEARQMLADIQSLQQKTDSMAEQNSQMKLALDQAKTELAQTKKDVAQMNAALEQSKNENSILRMKQQSQQTYLWVAIILAIVGIVH